MAIDIETTKNATVGEEQIAAAIREHAKAGLLVLGDITIDADGEAIVSIKPADTEAAISAHLLRGRLVADGFEWVAAPSGGVAAKVKVTDKPRKARAGKGE